MILFDLWTQAFPRCEAMFPMKKSMKKWTVDSAVQRLFASRAPLVPCSGVFAQTWSLQNVFDLLNC